MLCYVIIKFYVLIIMSISVKQHYLWCTIRDMCLGKHSIFVILILWLWSFLISLSFLYALKCLFYLQKHANLTLTLPLPLPIGCEFEHQSFTIVGVWVQFLTMSMFCFLDPDTICIASFDSADWFVPDSVMLVMDVHSGL